MEYIPRHEAQHKVRYRHGGSINRRTCTWDWNWLGHRLGPIPYGCIWYTGLVGCRGDRRRLDRWRARRGEALCCS